MGWNLEVEAGRDWPAPDRSNGVDVERGCLELEGDGVGKSTRAHPDPPELSQGARDRGMGEKKKICGGP